VFFNAIVYAKFGPGIPVPRRQTRMRPVYVGDVAAALAHLLDNEVGNEIVELVGPREYHFASLIAFFGDISKRKIRQFIYPKRVLKYDESLANFV
jgi:uncharacterized protein YbjT (DUF2867 family)